MNTSQYPHVLHVVEIILQIEDTVRKDQYGKASKNRKQNQNDLMS
jgi:hypothetical protein